MVATVFTTLIAATGALAVALPQSASEPLACVEPTNNFQGWSVTDFDYHWTQTFTTPAHSINHGYVSFNVTNPAIDGVVQCSGFSTVYPNFFNGNQFYDCTGTIVESMKFTFNSDTGALFVNQAWLCDTMNVNKTGSYTTNLSCRDTGRTTNPDWQMGEVYSDEAYNCDVVDFTIPVSA